MKDNGLLTADDERVLARQIEAGVIAGDVIGRLDDRERASVYGRELQQLVADGRRARDRMVVANRGLVASIARRRCGASDELEDLIQEGTIGLIWAVERYDWKRGLRFSTCARAWIQVAIDRGTSRAVRLPAGLVTNMRSVAATEHWLAHVMETAPTEDELADAAGITVTQLRAVLSARATAAVPLSLNALVNADGQTEFGDLLDDGKGDTAFDAIANGQLTRQLDNALNQLSARDRAIIRRRFGLDGQKPATVAALAEQYGVARSWVATIISNGLAVLRDTAPGLREYVLAA
jgi:RNA polymerase primary sigma factor